MLPKEIAAKLVEFKVARHQVSRRIVRMNKRLAKELDSTVVKRRGWCWAMTSFGVDAYKASEMDLLVEGIALHTASEEERQHMAFSEREKAILRLKAEGVSDHRVSRKLGD